MVEPTESRVGILGYGRFGRALANLMTDAGLDVVAWDPEVSVPDPHHAATPADLLFSSRIVILAVPVHGIRDALIGIRAGLTEHHLVVDVASVKHGPIAAMIDVLGAEIPWVATHPLFGPSSIALGERPLDVVVCPNMLHPDAVARIRAVFEQVGCRVTEQEAEAHDLMMANTHALAFFVAKGMVDIGTVQDLRNAPPSFRAMAQTIESVRSDAGHLFHAIQRDNPFAADARQRLLDALSDVHQQLRDAAPLSAPSEPMGIPDLGKLAPEVREARDLIDELDYEIVRLLARRANIARRVGRIKADIGRSVRDANREQELLIKRRDWARQFDLEGRDVVDIFNAILAFSRRLQHKVPQQTRGEQ